MLLNVVIAAYNAEKTIGLLVKSLDHKSSHVGSYSKDDIAITIVNDASTDSTLDIIKHLRPNHVAINIINNDVNCGRGVSINKAVSSLISDYILLVDADCEAKNENYLSHFIELIRADKSIVFAPMEDPNNDFWAHYFNRSQGKKTATDLASFSTTNVLIKTQLFTDAGGFNHLYKSYGFEDRDLLLRIMGRIANTDSAQKIEINNSAVLLHHTGETIEHYCHKQYLAGKLTRPIFYSRFPENYKKMSYSRCDSQTTRLPMTIALTLLAAMLPTLMKLTKGLIERQSLPLNFRIKAVQVCAALSYFNGSKTSKSQSLSR